MTARSALRTLTLPVATFALLGFVLLGDSPSAKPKRHSNWGDVYLGVYTQSVDKELATTFKLSVDRGAIVNEVEPDSPADKAGIKEDDVITSINGHEIYDEDDLVDEIQAFDVGDRVKVTLVRDGKTMTVDAELDERAENESINRSLRGLARLDELRALQHPNIGTPGGHAPRAYAWSGDQLRELEMPGYIGISYSDLTDQLATHFGINGDGAMVTEVHEKTPAEKAGLKAGDIITKVDDASISSRNSLSELISDFHVGDTAKLTVVRDKKTMTLPVIVDERDDGLFGYSSGSLRNTLRGSARQMDKTKRELDAALRAQERTRGLRHGDDAGIFDSEEYKAEMDALKRELELLREELKSMRK